MVEAEFTLEHPLKYSKKSAFWWLATYVIRLIGMVAGIYFIVQSIPWDDPLSSSSAKYLLFATYSFLSCIFLTKLTWKQVRYHTAGYMAEFSIFDRVTGPSPVFNYLAWFIVELAIVGAVYLFNPSNSVYSSIFYGLGIYISAMNILSMVKLMLRVGSSRYLDRREYFLSTCFAGVNVLVIASLYLAFPTYAGTPTIENVVVIVVQVPVFARVAMWGVPLILKMK